MAWSIAWGIVGAIFILLCIGLLIWTALFLIGCALGLMGRVVLATAEAVIALGEVFGKPYRQMLAALPSFNNVCYRVGRWIGQRAPRNA